MKAPVDLDTESEPYAIHSIHPVSFRYKFSSEVKDDEKQAHFGDATPEDVGDRSSSIRASADFRRDAAAASDLPPVV